MKKVLLLSLVAVLFCCFISSCKSHEKCPAYSKINKEKVEKPA